MFTIRNEQVAAMERAATHEFEEALFRHVQECFPEERAELNDVELREFIRRGIAKAESQDFTTQYEVCLFVDLTLLLHEDFDVDPELPWAAELLQSPSLTSEERIEALYDEALAFLEGESASPEEE